MAGQIKVAVVSGPISSSGTGTADFTKTGFGTPKACIVLLSFDTVDDVNVAAEGKASIGFSDFTNHRCISHQDEDGSAKVDSDCRKSPTKAYVLLTVAGAVDIDGTVSTITDGVRLTNTTNGSASAVFATVIMFGGADLQVSLDSVNLGNGVDLTTVVTTGIPQDLVFFIGVDIAGEDSSGTGINNSFGVADISNDQATIVNRCMGWASDHNNVVGSPASIIRNNRCLKILTEAAGDDWGVELTAATTTSYTITTRDVTPGAGMEVYALALDLDNRGSKVGSVDSPNGGGIIDNYDFSNATSDAVLGDGSIEGYAQSFTGDGNKIDEVVLLLKKLGSPTGNAVFKIYAHSGTFGTSSIPTGAALATSDNLDVSTLTVSDQEITLSFPAPFTTLDGIKYCVAIEYNAGDGSNHVLVRFDNTAPTHAGNIAQFISSWTAFSAIDLVFEVSAAPSWTPAVALGFIPQYVGLGLTHAEIEGTIEDDANAGGLGISSNTGAGEEAFHGWYNEDASLVTNTNNNFRSRVIDFRDHNVATVIHDHSHSSFNNGDWTYTINTENETTAKKWFYWAIEESAPAGQTIICDTGVYALVGLDTNTEWGHLIDAALGIYSLVGLDTNLRLGFVLDAALGTYVLVGPATNLIRTHVLDVALGTYSLAGPDTNTEWGHRLDAALGTYVLTGIDVNLRLGFLIDAATGVYNLAGPVTNLLRTHILIAALGTYSLAGPDTNTEWGHRLDAALGTYVLVGIDVDLRLGLSLDAALGTYSVVGPATNLIRTHILLAALGVYSLVGPDTNTEWGHLIDAALGTYAVTGIDIVLRRGFFVDATTGVYILDGPVTNFIRTHILIAALGAYVLAGPAANLEWGHLLIASLGTYSLAGTATILTRAVNLVAALGAYVVVGIAINLIVGRTLIASLGVYSLVGIDVDLIDSSQFVEDAGQLAPLERIEIDSLTISNSGDDSTIERGF